MKKYLSVRSHELKQRKYMNLVYRASKLVGAFSKIYPELFPASPPAQLQEITVSTFSIQLDHIRLQSPIGSKKSPSTLFRSNWDKYDYNLRSNRKNTWLSCRKSPSVLFRSNWVKHDYNLRSDRNVSTFFRSSWVKYNCNQRLVVFLRSDRRL